MNYFTNLIANLWSLKSWPPAVRCIPRLLEHSTPQRRSDAVSEYVFGALPTHCGIVPALVAGRAHFWSAAGSEAPRRFGFGARARPGPCVHTGARRKSKAPSPLRSAGALQNLNAEVVPRCARRCALILTLFLFALTQGLHAGPIPKLFNSGVDES